MSRNDRKPEDGGPSPRFRHSRHRRPKRLPSASRQGRSRYISYRSHTITLFMKSGDNDMAQLFPLPRIGQEHRQSDSAIRYSLCVYTIVLACRFPNISELWIFREILLQSLGLKGLEPTCRHHGSSGSNGPVADINPGMRRKRENYEEISGSAVGCSITIDSHDCRLDRYGFRHRIPAGDDRMAHQLRRNLANSAPGRAGGCDRRG